MRFIGGKTLLLEDIENLIMENTTNVKTFMDIFSGTAVVARYFKKRYRIYSNDLLYFSYVLQRGTVGVGGVPEFKGLKEILRIDDPVEYLNIHEFKQEEFDSEKLFIYNNYAPNGDCARMYLTSENALRIDYVRITIESWKEKSLINEDEYFYLLASLIECVPSVSNISGTYGAYLKSWDKRVFNKLKLSHFDIISNGENNICFNEDGNMIIERVKGDVLYIDPPYNDRQYLPNYHILETVAKYDYPEVKGVTGLRPYSDVKSKYCVRSQAAEAFDDLIRKARFRYIVLSYNTEGLIPVSSIEEILKSYGKPSTYKLVEIPYRRFKSRSTNFKGQLRELLFFIEKEV